MITLKELMSEVFYPILEVGIIDPVTNKYKAIKKRKISSYLNYRVAKVDYENFCDYCFGVRVLLAQK